MRDGGPAATETDRMVAIRARPQPPRAGWTILLIEHVMRAVMALASRVLVLDHGIAIAEARRRRSCATPPGAVLISAWRRSDAAGRRPRRVLWRRPGARRRVARHRAGAQSSPSVGANGAGKTTLHPGASARHAAAAARAGRLRGRDISAGRAIVSAISASARCGRPPGVSDAVGCGKFLRHRWPHAGRAPARRVGETATVCWRCSGLGERARQAAGTLSGGEQQMLAIGRCLMGAPEMIMFDEPSLGLAPNIVRNVLDNHRRAQTARA